MQPLFNLAHQPHGNDNGDNVALVADQRNFVQPAKHRLVGLHALRSNGPGVLQVGVRGDLLGGLADRLGVGADVVGHAVVSGGLHVSLPQLVDLGGDPLVLRSVNGLAGHDGVELGLIQKGCILPLPS